MARQKRLDIEALEQDTKKPLEIEWLFLWTVMQQVVRVTERRHSLASDFSPRSPFPAPHISPGGTTFLRPIQVNAVPPGLKIRALVNPVKTPGY